MSGIIKRVEPEIDHTVRSLCVKEYPGHKKGCPNFNHKDGCPPNAFFFDKVYDLSKPVYAIVNKFDFKYHVNKMRALHPEWSDRQCECCLYWQPGARKQLFEGIKKFLTYNDKEYFKQGYRVEKCPEAMGVEITKTLAKAGIILEWPPANVAYQVALAAIPIKT
jgi:predicted metal-binding protein